MSITAPATPVSTVPAAIAYLASAIQTQLNTDSDPADILLIIGEPSEDAPDVFVQIVTGSLQRTVKQIAEIAGWHAGALGEEYDVNVVVSVAQATLDPVNDPLALVQRAWQIVGYVETAVRLDLSLGKTVLVAKPRAASGGSPNWSENGVGRICEITVPIHCFAII